LSAETDRIPANYTALTDEEHIKKMNLLLEHLEDNDDVQNVYHNWEMPEEE
ncbi:MAG: YebC/PmpR family DNA-binding transcriptional regulator, partial [Ruminococcus sp.]|nr:YebC/PmpR family DNA-binding transcriptional regulator [Ruminococcus sp.]